MLDELTRRWWIVAARGVTAVLIGLALFVARVETLGLLVSFFGVLAIADGIFVAGAGLAVDWLALFLEGIAGISVGGFTFLYPAAAELWFVPLIVAWAVVMGSFELIAMTVLYRRARGSMSAGGQLMGALGVISILFGLGFGLRPDVGALTGTLGAYALVSGVLLTAIGLNVRTWPRDRLAGVAHV